MIGVFDSGLGGLSVLAAIARELPSADLVYVADTAHVPYGEKDDAFIRSRALRIGKYLREERGCELIVVACNTATAGDGLPGQAASSFAGTRPGLVE